MTRTEHPPYSIATFTGPYFDYSDPESWSGNLSDIAHGLSNICRFSGQGKHFYSVGQHSLFVYHLMCDHQEDNRLEMAALFHDGHEAFFGDVATPLKQLLVGSAYSSLCRGFDEVLAGRLGIEAELFHSPMVKELDRQALEYEGSQFFANIWKPTFSLSHYNALLFEFIRGMSPSEVEETFTLTYERLFLEQA